MYKSIRKNGKYSTLRNKYEQVYDHIINNIGVFKQKRLIEPEWGLPKGQAEDNEMVHDTI